jgi:asparagine synthase (glutamine-hydrolysing)
LNVFIAARFASSHGVRVLLSGVGADELFGGYPSFTRVPALAAWHRAASMAGPLTNWLGHSMERAAPGPKLRRVGDLLSQPPSLARAHAAFRAIFTRREASVLTRRYLAADSRGLDPGAALHGDPRESISALELTSYARNQLLRDADVMAMAAGVEVRTPFLDRELAAAVWNLPSAVRLRTGKRLLADAVPEVPARAFGRPKGCFQFPFERWLDGDWHDVFAGIVDASPVPLETWYRKWSVFAMEQAVRNLNEARHA